MNKFNKYVLDQISFSFFMTFIPIFSILVLVLLNEVLNISTVIKLDLLDVIKIFFSSIDSILIYSFTLSFLLTATIAINGLSQKFELVVAFTLGIKPNIIVRILAILGGLISMSTIILIVFIHPYLSTLKSNVKIKVKNSNIKNVDPKSYSKLGAFSLSIDPNINKYVLYFKNGNFIDIFQDIYTVNTKNNVLKVYTNSGEIVKKRKDSIIKIIYEKSEFNYRIVTRKVMPYMGYRLFMIRANHDRFIMKILIALMPIVFIFIIPVIAISHDRYKSKKIYLYIMANIAIYLTAVELVIPYLSYYTIAVVPVIFMLVTYYLYHKYIYKRFWWMYYLYLHIMVASF